MRRLNAKPSHIVHNQFCSYPAQAAAACCQHTLLFDGRSSPYRHIDTTRLAPRLKIGHQQYDGSHYKTRHLLADICVVGQN